jgi:competence protein ComFC
MSSSTRLLRNSPHRLMQNVLHLLFPSLCLICGKEVNEDRNVLCSFCEADLPLAFLDSQDEDNPLQQLFWGRVSISNAFAYLKFEKHLLSQELLHQIKYKDKPELANFMGRRMGEHLLQLEWMKEIDAFIPVPIHPKKAFIRGYNQSEQLSLGLSETTLIPTDNNFLTRTIHTESQTRKGRFKRWDNIAEAFKVRATSKGYQHIAIIDDVVTTGSTIERITLQLMENYPDLRVSIISLAVAV